MLYVINRKYKYYYHLTSNLLSQTSDQAKFIASTTVNEHRPSGIMGSMGIMGPSLNMDPRALNRIFPEEISSVPEFLKKNRNNNLRGPNSVEAEDEDEDEKKDKKKEKNKEKEEKKGKKSKKASKKSLIEENIEGEVLDNYANKLDSMA